MHLMRMSPLQKSSYMFASAANGGSPPLLVIRLSLELHFDIAREYLHRVISQHSILFDVPQARFALPILQ